ncbi:BCCT family transporter [Adlercreutzia sp. ZJ141]|uniref:BCCT family transporter n=1 Tax=Adlercreutzia sp. ZJ141 TaxID=2709406 RepID=UPI0013EE1304|nr:BCCT family transporter [Adlercreutzia sp. ZJ141]
MSDKEYTDIKKQENETGEIDPEAKQDQANRLGRKVSHDFIIRGIAVAVVAASLLVAIVSPEGFIAVVDNIRTFVTQYCSWWIVLMTFLSFAVCVFVAFSKYGKIRLGGKDARPAFSYFSWITMLFATGQGVGLVFWAVAEPLWMMGGMAYELQDSVFAGDMALAWTYFHWALPAWAVYAVVSLFLSYSRYNMKKDNTFRGSIENLFGEGALSRVVGIIVEALAVLATIFGLTTSIGCASYQFVTGLGQVFGLTSSTGLLVGTVCLFGGLATLSVWLGVVKGIKNISNINAVLSIVFMILVFIFGPTLYILGVLPESLAVFVDQFFMMSGYTEAVNLADGIASYGESWQAFWSFFIFCWCFAFGIFTAGFISTISRGRSLREFLIGVVLVGASVCVVWTVIVGGAGVWASMTNPSMIEATMADSSMGLFATINSIPHITGILAVIAIVLIGGYMVTSVDSGVMALSSFVSPAAKESRTFKAVLALCITALAAAFVLTAGQGFLTTIQFATVAGGVPFSVVVVLMGVQFFKWVRHDPQLVELGEATPFAEDSREARELREWEANTVEARAARAAQEAAK